MLEFPLVYQGGPTPTLALSGSGQALGTGSGCPSTDQRLAPRSANCDLGAFEYQAISLPVNVSISGYQLGHKNFLASQSIQSDAMLLSGSNFILEAPNETKLVPGFEAQLGAQLEIW